MTTSPMTEWPARLQAAASRIRTSSAEWAETHRTEADPTTGEQWDRGQVLAHVAEFLPYWIAQAQSVIDAGGDGVPFGRVKGDPDRIAAIERDRREHPERLLDRMDQGADRAVAFLEGAKPDALALEGTHQTKGRMSVEHLVGEFVVAHLDEHATQLERPAP